ncbi:MULTISPECIES: TetR/AcrR family transcriptional regulator [Streptosporangium]|uniref:TetR/AcrR family transcriptional regulator n=1 Tax=Streptosporangium jomthongense TaxID=1193683 RepID=A0ABV8ETK9_9ACTN
MNGATTSSEPRPNVRRGRVDKRQAILAAAFRVFARTGYDQSCVREIAAEAGVAKPTIYNHLLDKEALFHEAMRAAAHDTFAEALTALDQLRAPEADTYAMLEKVGHHLLRCHCDERSWALRRLLHAEVTRFPSLVEAIHQEGEQRVRHALADRLARLALTGRLRTDDPDMAAEQFLALLTGPMEVRSGLGTRQVPDTETHAVVRAAVETFLRAYGT